MNPFAEIALLLLKMFWLWFVSIYKAVVPAKWQGLKNVSGELVLITGAGSGLGRLMSLRFAELGARLVLWDINETGNEETAQMARENGTQVKTYTVDLSSREKIYEAADKVKEEIGYVDILVNNAGIVTGRKFLDTPDHLIERTMDVNVNAHFWMVKSFLPAMMEKNHGHIVSIASLAALFGTAGLADYCASKFAAVGFDESMRNEITAQGKTGVKTTVVCPYFINTGMFTGVKTKQLPILDQVDIVNRIMDAILTNQAVLLAPKIVYLLYALKGLIPCDVAFLINDYLGANNTMDDFVGRSKNN